MKLIATLVALMFCTTAVAADLYVSPAGSDNAKGHKPDEAFATINHALQRAEPGDTVYLLPGEYQQDIRTVRDGLLTKPITIAGLKGDDFKNDHSVVVPATVTGGGEGRIVQIRHSYIQLQDFVVDGLSGDPVEPDNIRDKLVFVHSEEREEGLRGVRIERMILTHAGGECLRFRHRVSDSEIAYNSISDCGMHDFPFERSSKNGEAIYIGTSFKQWEDGKNPTSDADVSTRNRIHHNIITTRGNECVDLKEGTTANQVYENQCTGQLDANSAGFNSAGNGNVFRGNVVYGNAGSGFRFGSDKKGFGIENIAAGNRVFNNAQFGFKIMNEPQAQLCGNHFEDNGKGEYYSDQGRKYAPAARCGS
ncbi:right-handed parallel beta-helix repeat-containing protein [Abyssibacter sp.]|uniref:right-handed parallel beta-helix repeat-containing protein n=1 Tax=Abyssibacter sp. TaxID=2320200 RepID=UPI0025BF42F5|nr:right-handed parallel beta-helix repeat-containing protein [Abyssibacter sp.]MCK5858328.1 right-handed parallel beta-helix repeat-containing protein [Abyssibacter sp.]